MMFKSIKNGDAVKDIATRRIDMKINMGHITKRFKVVNKLPGGHAPVADLVVDINFYLIVGAGLHTKPRITSCAGFRTTGRPVL